MKGLLFLGTVLLVLLVAAFGLARRNNKEGFQPQIPSPAPQIVVPTTDPKPAVLEGTSPGPYLPPIEKTYGPAYGEIARVNTLPYKDPTLEAATYKRLAELLESLKGFLAYESKGLQQMSDPTVQLPLATARGDLQRLTDEVAVLKRNPGMGSVLTQGQADDIQANLAYLQRKYRLSVNALSGIEGFQNAGAATSTTGSTDTAGTTGTTTDAAAAGATATTSQNTSPRATPEDLVTLRERLLAEIARLSASGSTDPILQSRIGVLQQIKNDIEGLQRELQSGVRQPTDIPILKSDMEHFLPLMGDPSQALPQLINEANLPASVANLVPQIAAGNATSQNVAATILQNYGDAIFKGLTWNVELGYTPQNVVEVAKARAAAAQASTDPQQQGGMRVGVSIQNPADGQRYDFGDPAVAQLPRGEMEAVTDAFDRGRTSLQEAGLAPSRVPALLDWQARAGQICDSIRRRGLDPGDFGCFPGKTEVNKDFSWRGYARMICSRLLTTTDPGLPETCGCPPVQWPGWRS